MAGQRLLVLLYVALAVGIGALTVLAPFIGDGFGFLAFLLSLSALPVASAVVLGHALWRPTWRKVGVAAGALAVGALTLGAELGAAPAAGDWLFVRAHRRALDSLARSALDGRRRVPAGADPCEGRELRAQVEALGLTACRSESDRVAVVAGGLLNREHGYVFVSPGSRVPARDEETVGTRMWIGADLGGGWFAYGGH